MTTSYERLQSQDTKKEEEPGVRARMLGPREEAGAWGPGPERGGWGLGDLGLREES